ncbi:MCP methyltransferase, CheR-type [Desulfofarcimen acetoxidans DSM 771]|uniref:MCP methyltransferase, CheR-type n=1 Tax=Desulfofarcimen acetoxidans (strain ATCC 49208 / DSM 771 / KCTC 5769 / VKM B-1644 / 5575) TaxID=485916 RepID=C8W3H5_DESAS|nr:protein-glutamate O-methyltransferase CheR [Desulfofarcimen acetoxidans]ACV63761.1 MCP methyltransferase, CheR-type [Desulfofarcimen acetoxidans DSM 771]
MIINEAADQAKYNEQLEKLEIQLLLEGIYRHYGFDFRNYVYSSLRRRIWHRILAENLYSISGLQEKVLHSKQVMDRLLGDFCINVTEMFRDPSFFLFFRVKVLPLLKDKEFIRIWHAGCSTGEEVYSLAILLQEEGLYEKTRIYATDVSEFLLEKAKKGILPISKMQVYTQNYIKAGGTRSFSSYYKVIGGKVLFESYLKNNITFAQHNLVTDNSFNEFDVIFCRNVMIYFDKYLQSRVHKLFYDSLCLQGFLGLGNKEAIVFTDLAQCYEELSVQEKLYRKIK